MGKVRETLEEEKVRCDTCGAGPWVRCTAESGVMRHKPHAHRIARYNGLVPAPGNGQYARPREPIQYDVGEEPKRKR